MMLHFFKFKFQKWVSSVFCIQTKNIFSLKRKNIQTPQDHKKIFKKTTFRPPRIIGGLYCVRRFARVKVLKTSVFFTSLTLADLLLLVTIRFPGLWWMPSAPCKPNQPQIIFSKIKNKKIIFFLINILYPRAVWW